MSENVTVICWDDGVIRDVFFEPKETAVKRCLAHNLKELYDLADDGGLDDDTKEVVSQIVDLMKEDKWNEAEKLWQDENMCELDHEYNNTMEWRPLTNPEDIDKTLEWLKRN